MRHDLDFWLRNFIHLDFFFAEAKFYRQEGRYYCVWANQEAALGHNATAKERRLCVKMFRTLHLQLPALSGHILST